MGIMYRNTFLEYHLESCGKPNDMIAMIRNNATKVARPLRSFEKDAPPWRTTPDALVRTKIDIQLPMRPKVETMVSKMPSVTNLKMSSCLT